MTNQAARGQATLIEDDRRAAVVYMAQELSARRWKVLFGCGGRTRGPIDVAAGDVEREPAARIAVRLQQLKAIGGESAWVFACELLGWRRFANRRELAVALASRASAGTEVRRT